MSERENNLLTFDELIELTRKRTHTAQHRVLLSMGIRHATRPDGSVVLSRALVTALLGRYDETPLPPRAPPPVLNLDALRKRPRGKGRKSP